MLLLTSAKDVTVGEVGELVRFATIFAKPEMLDLGYTTGLPDDSYYSPTAQVAQLLRAVRVEALRNHAD
jgi:hypothetical protein